MALLDSKFRYWSHFYPIAVHPDFRPAILAAVRARAGNEETERWAERIETNTPRDAHTDTKVSSYVYLTHTLPAMRALAKGSPR